MRERTKNISEEMLGDFTDTLALPWKMWNIMKKEPQNVGKSQAQLYIWYDFVFLL